MVLKSIKEVKNLKGRRVVVRVGFDVPLSKSGRVENNYRIKRGLETLKYLIKHEAKIIILNHLGRPGGKKVKVLSNKPVATELSKLLNKKVVQSSEIIGSQTRSLIDKMSNGDLVMLENVRFHPREVLNCKRLARQLAGLGDFYVNDNFASAHRANSSIVAIAKYLPSYAGFLVQDEVAALDKVLHSQKHPKVAIIGGAKLETKVKVIKKLVAKTDYLLLGGAVANNVLKQLNYEVGLSKVDKTKLKLASNILYNKIKIPVDVVVAGNLLANAKNSIKAVGSISKKDIILDLGKDTTGLYKNILSKAKLVVWNGPLGYFEVKKYQISSRAIAKFLASMRGYTIIGGGETVEMIQELGLIDKFDFVSTGGGSMLEYLEGKILPGLKSLRKK